MISLRPYQSDSIAAIRAAFREGARAPLLVSPTGSGKTVMFAEITRGVLECGNSVLILAHRTELIDQIRGALNEFNVYHSVIAAGYGPLYDARVAVASVHTLIRRLSRLTAPTLIVIDEAHHVVANNTWGQILAAFPRARFLGVTATPVRLDGHGLGTIFDRLIVGPSTTQLIEAGYLAPLRVFAPAQPDTASLHRRAGEYVVSELEALMAPRTVTGNAISEYTKHAAAKRAIVFCVSVEHARAVAEDFRAAGFASQCIDGSLDRGIRREYVTRFRSGDLTVLTSCDLVSEGFDLPAIEVGISLRPTASVGLWLQQIGRCMRPYAGKSSAIILDHAGNSLKHGLPTDEREWSLEEGIKASGQRRSASHRICEQCFAVSPARAVACIECQQSFPVQAREIHQVEGTLTELPADAQRRVARLDQGQRRTLDDLIALGHQRGYKNPRAWAAHVVAGREKRGRV